MVVFITGLCYICAMVKSRYIGDGHPTFNRNPYNGYINPYYWVDDHPLLYGNNGSLDPGTYVNSFHFFVSQFLPCLCLKVLFMYFKVFMILWLGFSGCCCGGSDPAWVLGRRMQCLPPKRTTTPALSLFPLVIQFALLWLQQQQQQQQ